MFLLSKNFLLFDPKISKFSISKILEFDIGILIKTFDLKLSILIISKFRITSRNVKHFYLKIPFFFFHSFTYKYIKIEQVILVNSMHLTEESPKIIFLVKKWRKTLHSSLTTTPPPPPHLLLSSPCLRQLGRVGYDV